MLAAADEFDYVIVGGGTAGCVLANRLSADEQTRVLLLEPGPSTRGALKIAVPVALVKLFNSKWDWSFKAHPKAESDSRPIHLARGRALGGSGATNALLYHRGSAKDFDGWGCDGWGSKEMLSAFMRVEGQRRGSLSSSPFHSTSGPVAVEDAQYTNSLSTRFVAAAVGQGYAQRNDFNDWSEGQEGVGKFQLQTRRGRRVHAAVSHLRPALRRPNLEVRTGARVTRVLLDDAREGGDAAARAVGVAYVDEAAPAAELRVSLRAGGEVVLCAGAVASPQLLMLSGVGPRAQLARHGLATRVELPTVGAHLADHPAVVNSHTISRPISITDHMLLRGTAVLHPARLVQWALRGRGPLASTGCDYGGFFRVAADAKTMPAGSQPNLQLRFVSGLGTQPDGVASYEDIGKAGMPNSGMTFQSVAVRPVSRGRVELASADPLTPPRLWPGFCEAEEDLVTLREGIRLARRLAASEAFDDVRGEEVWPGTDIASDSELDEYIRANVHSANALAGSCRMGSGDEAVVDTKLRVRGVENLRVADASIMPAMPGAQLGATVFAIAEKAADILLEKRTSCDTHNRRVL